MSWDVGFCEDAFPFYAVKLDHKDEVWSLHLSQNVWLDDGLGLNNEVSQIDPHDPTPLPIEEATETLASPNSSGSRSKDYGDGTRPATHHYLLRRPLRRWQAGNLLGLAVYGGWIVLYG